MTKEISKNWWQALGDDFHKRSVTFDYQFTDQCLVNASAFADLVVKNISGLLLSALIMPSGCNPIRIKHTIQDRSFYQQKAESGQPQNFFKDPPKSVKVSHQLTKHSRFHPPDGICETLRFKSPFIPVNPRVRDEYMAYESNRMAYARFWRHKGKARPTICIVHGFSIDNYQLNQYMFSIPWFYEKGYNVLLYILPFHGKRESRYSLMSGQHFFTGGLIKINEVFAQSVYDFRIFLNYLKNHYQVEEAGVMGFSLGGYTTALLATVEKRLKFCLPIAPMISPADIFMEWFPIGPIIKTLLFLTRNSIEDIRHMLAVHCPLTYNPLIPKENLMIIGAAGDRITPPKHTKLLWEHWNNCRIHWFPGSHLIHLKKRSYMKEINCFFNDIQFGFF